MTINPYESPRLFPEEPRPAVLKIKTSPKAIPVSDDVSVIVISLAGIIGGTLFLGLMELTNANLGSDPFQFSLAVSSAATFAVLLLADARIQRRRPSWVTWIAAAIGMLLASPFAYAIAFGLGFIGYGLAAKNVAGAAVLGVLTFESFFLILSLGGWVTICRMR